MAKLVSKTYGDALFDLAVEGAKIDTLTDEVGEVEAALEENPQLLQLMEYPKIIREEKVKIIEEIFKGRVSDDMVGFLVIVVTKGRYKELSNIFAYYNARVKEYRRIGVAHVKSAILLDPAWRARIEAKLLETTHYSKMEMNYQVDVSLIGGLVIQIGDRVVDSSIKSRLAALTGQLTKLSLEA